MTSSVSTLDVDEEDALFKLDGLYLAPLDPDSKSSNRPRREKKSNFYSVQLAPMSQQQKVATTNFNKSSSTAPRLTHHHPTVNSLQQQPTTSAFPLQSVEQQRRRIFIYDTTNDTYDWACLEKPRQIHCLLPDNLSTLSSKDDRLSRTEEELLSLDDSYSLAGFNGILSFHRDDNDDDENENETRIERQVTMQQHSNTYRPLPSVNSGSQQEDAATTVTPLADDDRNANAQSTSEDKYANNHSARGRLNTSRTYWSIRPTGITEAVQFGWRRSNIQADMQDEMQTPTKGQTRWGRFTKIVLVFSFGVYMFNMAVFVIVGIKDKHVRSSNFSLLTY